MNNSLTLYQLTEEQQLIEDLLIENGGELTPEIEEALNANQLALSEKVDGYNCILRKFEGAETAIDAEIKRLTALKKTAQNAQKSLKSHIASAMIEHGIQKLEGNLCKISFRRSEAVDITDAALADLDIVAEKVAADLPNYVKVELSYNKTKIKELIKAGSAVPGASIKDNYSLQIR